MTRNLEKLTEIGSGPIRSGLTDPSRLASEYDDCTARSLNAIWQIKNGFYAFEGALHVLADCSTGDERGFFDWNSQELWRQDYHGMADGMTFFAEDAFGVQFAVCNGAIATFDPETGNHERIAEDIDEWAGLMLSDYALWTGYGLAREWQAKHGSLPRGARLVPITPFVFGGEYTVDNLHAIDAVEGMRLRAAIAVQIRGLPDGSPITFRVK